MSTNRKTRDDFERRTLPTVLDLRVGAPSMIQGLTSAAKNLQGFCNQAKAHIVDIGQTHFRVSDDDTLTPGARLVRSAEHATAKIKSARTSFAAKVTEAEGVYDALRAQLDGVLKPPSDFGQAQVDAELRAWLRTQDGAKAHQIARSDPRVMAAVARSAPQAAGLAPEVFAEIQKDYTRAVLPEVAAQFEDLTQAFKAARTAIDEIEREASTLIDFDTAEGLKGRKTSDLV